jgi:predicted RNase H-like HicB family nuclease
MRASMNNNLFKKAEELAARNYKIVFLEDRTTSGQVIYMAKNPELIGCMAQGATLEEAIENLKDARIDYIYDSLKDGGLVPDPAPLSEVTLNTSSGFLGSEDFVITKDVNFDQAEDITIQPSHSRLLYEAVTA